MQDEERERNEVLRKKDAKKKFVEFSKETEKKYENNFLMKINKRKKDKKAQDYKEDMTKLPKLKELNRQIWSQNVRGLTQRLESSQNDNDKIFRVIAKTVMTNAEFLQKWELPFHLIYNSYVKQNFFTIDNLRPPIESPKNSQTLQFGKKADRREMTLPNP
jgi:hypothetical protein